LVEKIGGKHSRAEYFILHVHLRHSLVSFRYSLKDSPLFPVGWVLLALNSLFIWKCLNFFIIKGNFAGHRVPGAFCPQSACVTSVVPGKKQLSTVLKAPPITSRSWLLLLFQDHSIQLLTVY
jgi:hypothetical protein